MISNTIELLGFSALVLAIYELAGRGFALLALGGVLLMVGLALDGVSIRLSLSRLLRKTPKKRLRMVDEPLTNQKIAEDELAERR